MKKQIPNTLSVIRIAGAVSLMFLPIFTAPFFAVYAVCAVLDFADGFFAKTLDAKSFTGDRLDHIASLLFIIILTARYFSIMEIPYWAVLVFSGIAVIKIASLVFGAVRYKKATFVGTDWNKWAKVSFYLIPLWYLFAGMVFTCVVVIATFVIAVTEEFIINITSKEYNPETKTIIPYKKILKLIKKK
jgi:CDP-diacylglycerol--glycerol-3-phosphate 3-phosphatidyltransferase